MYQKYNLCLAQNGVEDKCRRGNHWLYVLDEIAPLTEHHPTYRAGHKHRKQHCGKSGRQSVTRFLDADGGEIDSADVDYCVRRTEKNRGGSSCEAVRAVFLEKFRYHGA